MTQLTEQFLSQSSRKHVLCICLVSWQQNVLYLPVNPAPRSARSRVPVIIVGMATKPFPDWEQVVKLVCDS